MRYSIQQYRALSDGRCGTGTNSTVSFFKPKSGSPVLQMVMSLDRRSIKSPRILRVSNPSLERNLQGVVIEKLKNPSSRRAAYGSTADARWKKSSVGQQGWGQGLISGEGKKTPRGVVGTNLGS